MHKDELTWQHKVGRDREGDLFSEWICLHGSGRIMALVDCPATDDEYAYSVEFNCSVPQGVFRGYDYFIDLESAKAFIEKVLANCQPPYELVAKAVPKPVNVPPEPSKPRIFDRWFK